MKSRRPDPVKPRRRRRKLRPLVRGKPTLSADRVVAYIRDNPFKKITLEHLAQVFRSHYFAVFRSLQRHYGTARSAFFQMPIRIRHAKKLLRRKGATEEQVAKAMGLKKGSLRPTFLKYAGMHIREYKRRHRK